MSLLRTGCQCTTAAAPPLAGRPADPRHSPARDSEEARVRDLTLHTNETRIILCIQKHEVYFPFSKNMWSVFFPKMPQFNKYTNWMFIFNRFEVSVLQAHQGVWDTPWDSWKPWICRCNNNFTLNAYINAVSRWIILTINIKNIKHFRWLNSDFALSPLCTIISLFKREREHECVTKIPSTVHIEFKK